MKLKEIFQNYKKENPNADEASFYHGMLYLASLYTIIMQETNYDSKFTKDIIIYSAQEIVKLIKEIGE